MRKLICALSLLFAALPASATVRYVAQTAGTFTGGIACNGHAAITPATFNSTTLSPGDTTYLCGVISEATVNTTLLTVSQSGTSGNPITIFFDSGAVLKSPQWPAGGSGGAINVSGANYITINGNGGTGGYTQGIIESTLTGDSGATCLAGPCQYATDSNGIEADGSSNFTVEGLAIIDMYIVSSNPADIVGGSQCIYGNEGQYVNWTITNNLMHDMSWCINIQYTSGTSTNIVISGNTIYNIDHGIAIGGAANGVTFENAYIYGNNIHDYSIWDTGTADIWHHDGIHVWGNGDSGSDTISNIWTYNNTFGGCIGQNVTAHIFYEANSGNFKNSGGFNNTIIDTCAGADNDGMITTGQDSGYLFYNNTLISENTGNADRCMGTSSSPNVTWVNNVTSGCQNLLTYVASGGSVASGGLHNNIYAAGNGNCSSGGDNCFQYLSTNTGSFATWQSATGQDASPSAYVTSANLTTAGVPNSGSPVIGVGANLTSLCTGNLTLLCDDITGAARPTTGAWTDGAYNASSGPSYTWTPTISPSGGGTITGTNCSAGSYASATTIGACTAVANAGYSLASTIWSGVSGSAGCTGSTNPCASFSITANSAATANFTVNSYTLSTTTTGTGSGTITGCAGAYNYGASYSCTVTPSAGSTLASVTGCSGSGTTTYAGTMPASACTVTATFNLTAPNPAGTPILTLIQ